MTAVVQLWNFTERVPPERRRRLLSITSFDEVVQRLLRGKLFFFGVELESGRGRVFFRMLVPEETYDAFFNSPHGYRAQYCRGASYGEEQNRNLVNALTRGCIFYSEERPQPTFPANRIEASLAGAGAKVWITESDLPDVEEIHINYEPWVSKALNSTKGAITDQAARASAAVGVLAPVGTILEIKGAWVLPDCTEWADPRKASRADEIRDYGFT